MESCQKQFYRDQLRSARAVALADAEGFQAVFHSLELIGQQLTGKVLGLGGYKVALAHLAAASPLSDHVAYKSRACHTTFRALFDELRLARNDAMHQGAHARILTDHAVELTIILEDALMSNASVISQFMVRDVVEAKPWHPVSYVRQQMLKHAFSYIPVRVETTWRLIAEYSLAQYLRGAPSQNTRKKRLATRVDEAVAAKELLLLRADTAAPEDLIADTLQRIGERPILVVDPAHEDLLAGVLTSSDVL
jgi:CBS-domain-containing membrane protein